jgi:phosphoenolpyruvate carboxykinase (GTP)
MADYFGHWLKLGRQHPNEMPRVFLVNWFRKDADGDFIWPGFGENSRVLEWIFRRCEGDVDAVDSVIGRVPRAADVNIDGLELGDGGLDHLLEVDLDELRQQLPQMEEHLARFGDRLPGEIQAQVDALRQRLDAA